jgi:hypothetical protein
MANFTHAVGLTYRNDAGTVASTTATYSGDSESNFNETIPPSAANAEYDWTLTKADVQSMAIFASAAMTLYSNAISTGSPDDTIALAAGQLIIWTHDSGMTNPFSHADVTKIYVTSTAGGLLKIRALLDVAP